MSALKQWSLFVVMVACVGGTACTESDDRQAQIDEALVGCSALATGYADACARCAGPSSWQECYDEIGAVCPTATSLRDADALYDVCLPWLERVSCAAFLDPDLPLSEGCLKQIRY
jgi:hypothetical protein